MNRRIEALLVVLIAGFLALAAEAGVITYRATTDDRHIHDGHGYSKSGDTETFIIAAADRQGRLTPRVERWFQGKGTIQPGKGVYTFSATYRMEAANNTTIFQLLNHDPKSDDVHKPLCFITVFPSEDGTKWQIHRANSVESPLLATIPKADAFTVKLQTDGARYHIWINGDQVLSADLKREGKGTSMRYGAYHHGKGLAKVHVTNATFQLDPAAKLPEPPPAKGK